MEINSDLILDPENDFHDNVDFLYHKKDSKNDQNIEYFD